MSESKEKTTNEEILNDDDDLERLLNETAEQLTGEIGEDTGAAVTFEQVETVEDIVDAAFTEDTENSEGSLFDLSEEAEDKAEEAVTEVSEEADEKAEEAVSEVSIEDLEKVKEAEPDDIKEKEPFNFGREVLEWLESLVFALLIVQLVLTFLFRVVMVDGRSMTNTLQNGDRLIMHHLAYEPKRDDIVVLDSEEAGKVLIKRVIGIAGDKVVVDYNTNHVYVNDEQISNEHIKEPMLDNWYYDTDYLVSEGVYEYDVPEDTVFVMGDNRNDSNDSRSLGFIPKSEIMGKAILRIYPFKSLSLLG